MKTAVKITGTVKYELHLELIFSCSFFRCMLIIDPNTEYRKSYGIIENDTIIKTKTTFVNINSKNRNINPLQY